MRQQASDDPKVLTTTEARQASPRKLNLRVLIGSMLLVVIVGGILYAAFFSADF